jgi:hypothetical protein
MAYEEVLERFPMSYSRFVKAQAELECGEKTVIRRHPEVLVVVDNEAPAERGVLIVRMSWDKDVGKSEGELRQSGRESRVDTQRCDVDSLVATLEDMVNGKDDK